MKRIASTICAVFFGLAAIFGFAAGLVSCSDGSGSSGGLNGFNGSVGLGSSEGGNAARVCNSVVLVNFSGEERKFGEKEKEVLQSVFFDGEDSLKSYISFISQGKTEAETQIIGEVTLDYSADYFSPAYEIEDGKYVKINENGYDNRLFSDDLTPAPNGGKTSADAFLRSEELVAATNEKIAEKIAKGFNADGDGDGFVDCFTLVFALDETPDKDSLLWAKKSVYLTGNTSDLSSAYVVDESERNKEIKTQKLGNKSINDYIFIPYPMLERYGEANSVAVCHEFLHVLGAADAYSYEKPEEEAVGELDIMAAGYDCKNPSMPLSYTLYKIGFLSEGENVAPVLKPGEYSLFSTESAKGKIKAYKLVLPAYRTKNESFYIEYREATGYGRSLSNGFDGGAFVIYRVNERNGYILPSGVYGDEYLGNAYGDEEIYVYRFNKLTLSGYRKNETVSKNGISHAAISDLDGYSSFGEKKGASDKITYSDGTDSGVTIAFKKRNADGSATFEINFVHNAETPAEVDYRGILKNETGIFASFYAPFNGGNVYVLETNERLFSHSPEDIASGKYGKPQVVPAAFMRAPISGEKDYVYVVYEENGKLTEKAHALVSVEDAAKKAVLISVGALLVGSAAVAAVVLFYASRKKRKRALDEEKNQPNGDKSQSGGDKNQKNI